MLLFHNQQYTDYSVKIQTISLKKWTAG